MATLDSLKRALREKAKTNTALSMQPLSNSQYSAGYQLFAQDLECMAYQDFVIPQLSQLLAPLLDSRVGVSVLEIGPGPKSVLGSLPDHLKQKIKSYAALEPNSLFAARLGEWLCSTSQAESPLPGLKSMPDIRRIPFSLDKDTDTGISIEQSESIKRFDVILFCHSMYGMKPRRKFIERALNMLVERPEDGMVVVFHRDEKLYLDGLACYRTTSFPSGLIRVKDDDEVLDRFAPFVAGCSAQHNDSAKSLTAEWREVCRVLGRQDKLHPGQLLFGAPDTMAAFTRHSTALPELTALVPLASEGTVVKNWEARLHRPASIVRPTEIQHVQQCVSWALKHKVGLTVVGGGHSGHCRWPNVVSVDMGAFDQIHIFQASGNGQQPDSNSHSDGFVVAGAGCKSGDIIRKALAAGLTVPLGARPSVGAGLWLQGGIGHLARLHGLACDAIVGAVMVSVASAQVFCVGRVPSQHRPAGAVTPDNEAELLWALKGAGTNFGIVIDVVFEAYPAPTYSVRSWVVQAGNKREAQLKLSDFDDFVARKLPHNCSADAYLYADAGELYLGVTTFESTTGYTSMTTPSMPTPMDTLFGPADNSKIVDSVGLFDAEMYMSGMHGGHGGGKTSSFKRCLFLKRIGSVAVSNTLVAAIDTRPSLLCYIHLLQGGGAVADVADDATAFGCRDWDFACVLTGIWPRDQDGTEVARAAVQWVYDVASDLLPLSSGAYGADLGPDPRDAALAVKAFGPNRARLARLKHKLDKSNVLAYACPLPPAPTEQKLVILVTGESCAGKDYCADIWASMITACKHKSLSARAVSISDAIKREYAAVVGADLKRLLDDRVYKEQHRPALSTFFQARVKQNPSLPEDNFLNLLYGATDVDVLLITGMRDEAPVTTLSHLVPGSKLVEVNVKATKETRRLRRQSYIIDDHSADKQEVKNGKDINNRPEFIFNNDITGSEAAKSFFESFGFPLLHGDVQRLASMVHLIPNFPRPGIEFHHVLDISQHSGGLNLCTSLLQTRFSGDWSRISKIACCEAGGFIFASSLAARVDMPLVLIREASKLPPPTLSVSKPSSHISSCVADDSSRKQLEMGRDVVPRGASVVVVDDVLATGKTLCAMLQLLQKAGVNAHDVSIMVVAEFPVHRGRELLRGHGFGGARVQSLLVFDGA